MFENPFETNNQIDKKKVLRNAAIARLAQFIEKYMYDTDWTLLADVVGVGHVLDAPRHERVRRAQNFGDPDYPSAVSNFLQEIFDSDEEIGRFLVGEIIQQENFHNESLDEDAKEKLARIVSFFNYTSAEREQQFTHLLSRLELDEHVSKVSPPPEKLFQYQFPAGLPFGLKKPNLALIPGKGSQSMYFEDDADIGIIRNGVYPDFHAEKLKQIFRDRKIGGVGLLPALLGMNTDSERKLFVAYMSQYSMWTSTDVPVLIPQAWIQWHSMTKRNLRALNSSYIDGLYRVDFVAFWNMKRFAILVDDISHYAVKRGTRWDANEEAYSKRLKEDRKLRKEGWLVFRVSNWEMRKEAFIPAILNDLRELIGF
jgi:hypothetical protein